MALYTLPESVTQFKQLNNYVLNTYNFLYYMNGIGTIDLYFVDNIKN